MEIRKTSIYDNFICTADKCPENCCRGWRIHIDDETVQKYLEMKGKDGIIIRMCMQTDDTMPYFSRRSIVCPLMTLKGLCSIQKKYGADLMPEICRRFPRDIRNYGPFTEMHLDPACTRVSEMILESSKDITLVSSEGEIDLPLYGNNDDMAFLTELLASRSSLTELFRDSEEDTVFSLDEIFGKALRIAFKDHERVLGITEGNRTDEIRISNFPLPVELLNEMIDNSFYKDSMLYYSPFFYRLFRLYFRYFDDLTPAKARHRFDEALNGLIETYPELKSHIFAYIRYSLEREYLTTYEDYSFIKRILDNIICSNLILLLETVYWMKHKTMSLQVEARIISMCERRARHNESILRRLSEMYKNDTPDFFLTDPGRS